MSNLILQQLREVQEDIKASAKQVGRNPDTVRLVAVSKTFPAAAIETAYAAGQRLFGENRVQELTEKAASLPQDIQWHMIGHLQSNKVAKVVDYADYIHAVDSVKLLQRIERIAGEKGRCPKILLEINISGEESKFGIAPADAPSLVEAAQNCRHLELVGLMTMAPFGAAPETLHQIFGSLRRLRDQLASQFDINLPELSMGMSSDYKIAIAEGATLVRIGSAIFGKRNYQP